MNNLKIYLILQPNEKDILGPKIIGWQDSQKKIFLKLSLCRVLYENFNFYLHVSLKAENWSSKLSLTYPTCHTARWHSDSFGRVGCWTSCWEMVNNVSGYGLNCKTNMALVLLSKSLRCVQHICSLLKKLYE